MRQAPLGSVGKFRFGISSAAPRFNSPLGELPNKPLTRWLLDVSRGTIAALLLAAPIAAPVASASGGFAGTAVVVHGTANIAVTGNVQTITLPASSAVTTINWTPTDTGTGGGAIDFLPAANTVSYVGQVGAGVTYNVLNRIIPTDQTRTAAFNGTVNSTANTHVWFYSPGGLLIGKTAVFNVGGLVLTTADPVSDEGGHFISTTSGTDNFSFAGVVGSTSAITIQPGAKISAITSGQSNYIVAIAPQINQGGTISVAGSVALVAAESASFAVDGTGLFNITVSAGTTVADNTFVHTGSTGGPNADPSGNHQRVYMVAVPKNNAISMAIASSGSIGFAVADAANVDGNAIVLSAGSNIADSGSGNPVVAARAGGGTANLTVGGGNYTANVYAVSTDAVTIADPALDIAFASDLTLVSVRTTINAQAGTISVGGNLTENSDDTRGGTGGIAKLAANGGSIIVGGNVLVSAIGAWSGTQNAGNTRTQGGTAQVAVTSGGLTVGGNLTVDAGGNATGSYAALITQGNNSGAGASGGAAGVMVTGPSASLSVTGGISAHADAISGIDGYGNGGEANGGTALIEAASGGTIGVGLNGAIGASATASAANLKGPTDYGRGGASFGGTAQVIANAGTITVAGVNGISANANATGGVSAGYSGSGGNATGGMALIATQGASGTIATDTSGSTATTDFATEVSATALGADGAGSSSPGGNAQGGTATLETTGANQAITLDHGQSVGITAFVVAGNGVGFGGGRATGGTAQLLASGGSIAITHTGLSITAGATGGYDYASNGGNATGGTVQLAASGGGTLNAALAMGLSASATGGYGSGNGGNAVGGNILIDLGNNAFNFGSGAVTADLDTSYTAGMGSTGNGTGSSAGGVRVTDLGTATLGGTITLTGNTPFYVQAGGSIAVSGSIGKTGTGAYAHLWADDLGSGTGTVTLATGALNLPGSQIDIYYNPVALGTPTDFSAGIAAGTATAYQLVDNIDQVQLVASYLSQNFALGRNIDAGATQGWNGGAGFVPLGNYLSNTPFSGNFDGLGHAVTNLYINTPTTDDVGLFGYIQPPSASAITIRNVGLVDVNFSGHNFVGGLIGAIGCVSGSCQSITVTNSYVAGGSITGNAGVGGLIAAIGGTQGSLGGSVISNDHADVAILIPATGAGNTVGGLIGQVYPNSGNNLITQVFATGSITDLGSSPAGVGGLVGFSSATIDRAYATGAVTGGANAVHIGGLIGRNEGSVAQAYATGAVTVGNGSSAVGGLVGYNDGTLSETWASGLVTAPSSSNIGGLIGSALANSVVINSYWDSTSTEQTIGIGTDSGTTTNLKAVSSNPGADYTIYAFGSYAYQNFSAANWVYDNNLTRPVGAWEIPVAQFGVANIESAHQVQLIDYNLGGSYLVTQNIDMRGTQGGDIWSANGFMPLGAINTDPPFTGTLAGAGHVLSNLTMTPGGGYNDIGLIQDNYGTIKDLGLANVNITVPYATYIGTLVGYNGGQIIDSFATGTITLTQQSAVYGVAGGLVGLNFDGALNQGFFYGNRGTITQSYATVAVTGGAAAGGLVGDNEGGISGSYANGTVSGTLTGGLVGESTDASGPTVANSYWDTELTGQSTGCGSIGYSGACSGATGLTTAQTLQSASFAGFTIDTQGGQGLPWRQYEGDTTPLLAAFLTPISVQPGSLTMQYDAATHDVGVTTYGAQPSGIFGNAQIDGLTKNAGTANLTYVGGLYSNQLGYDFVPSTTPGTLVITPAPLTLAATSDARGYDATTNSAGVVQIVGLLGEDFVAATQSFASPNVMGTNGSTLVVDNGYFLNDGNGGNNYTVTLQSAAGTITPAALTLAAVSDTKVYDATTSSAGVVQVAGLFGGDNVTSLTQSFTSPNAMGINGSTLAVDAGYSVNDGNGGNNYTVALHSARGTITPAQLMLTLAAVSDTKVYDGTTNSSGTPQTIGLMGSDNVTNLSQSFTSANAMGTNGSTLVVDPGYSVNDGNNGNNYTVALHSAEGTITPATLTLTAVTDSRTYNATTGSAGVVRASGLFGENNVSGLTQSFASANALGTNGSTLVVNPGYVVNDGNGGGNYTVTLQNALGTISPAALAILYTANASAITYGTIPSGLSGTVSQQGLQGSDTLASVTSGTAGFTTAATARSNVGSYAITGGGLAGNSSNYSFSFAQAAGNASALTIGARALTLTADPLSRAYGSANPATDTATAAAATATTGLVNGDSVSSEVINSPAQSNSGVGSYALNGSAAQFGSGLGSNYAISYAANPTGLTVTPALATITYLASSSRSIYGDAPTGFSGSESVSGLVNSDTLGSVTSGTADFATTATGLSNVGSYEINGSGLSGNNGNYSFSFVQAPGNATALTIVQRALTLTANPISRQYGGANPTSDSVTATGAITDTGVLPGLVNGDSVSSETVTSPAGANSGVGSYAVNGSAAQFGSGLGSNYAISYAANATGLTITPAAATITYVANAQTSIYGNAPARPTGSENASGLVNGDTVTSVTSGTAGFASTATGLSSVGNYTITGSGLSGNTGNYSFSFVQAAGNATALTIVQRALTLTANPLSRIYGSANPTSDTLVATAATATTGLVNGDSIGSEAVTSPATSGSSVGSYALNGSAAQFGSGAASNYAITYAANPAGLTITPASATITYMANPLNSIYGNTPIGLSGSESTLGLVNGDTLGSITTGTASFATTASGLSSVGSYAITGSGLAGSPGNYRLSFVQAAGNSSALTIVQRALTLTANPISRSYGSANPVTDQATATAATATTGLVNGDSIGSEAVTSPAIPGSSVGSYALTGSAAQFGSGLGSNYAISYAANATGLTITPAAATITYVANPQNSIYGNTPTSLSGSESVAGLVNGDTLGNVTSGTAGFATTATGLANVGSYAITGSGLSGSTGNYSFGFVQAAGNTTALTIVPRALTLTADPLSRVYGSTNPITDTATAATTATTGLVDGDTIVSETVASPATSGSDVGSYALTGSAAQFGAGVATNYVINYAANATGLSITPAALTLIYSADPATRTYGAQNPALSGTETATGLVNEDTLGSVTGGAATYTAAAGANANVGGYAINGSGLTGSSANYTYSFAQAPGNATALAVTPAAVTITYTAAAQSSIYGNVPRGLTGGESASGLVNDDTLGSIVGGSASYATSATATSNVGTYGVAGSGLTAGSSNYSFSFVQAPGNAAALTITPRPITVTADPQLRDVGAPDPVFTYVVTGPPNTTEGSAPGLVNGDTLTGRLASTATMTSPVGKYDIVQGTLMASANYQLTYVGNFLTLGFGASPILEVTNAIAANLPDQTGTTTLDQRRKQEAAALAALAASAGLHPPQISQSMIDDHQVTTPSPVNEPVTSNGNSSLWSPTAP